MTEDFRHSPTNGPATRLTTKADERDQNMAVRAWAARHGMEIGTRGRLPAELVDAYNAGDVADARDWYAHRRTDAPRRPAMPQLDFYARVADWVAPGGTLLVVGHLAHDGDAAGHGHGHAQHDQEHVVGHAEGQPPPPEASITAADVAARLGHTDWRVITAD